MVTAALPRIRPALAVLAGLLLAAVMLISAPGTAFAHDELVESSPSAGEAVETLPPALTLTYSAALLHGEGATVVEVTGPDGSPVAEGEPLVDGTVVRVPLIAEAPAGAYRVVWRVVSSDGHPIDGEFDFEVRTSTLAEEPEPAEEPSTAPSTAPDATAGTDPSDAEKTPQSPASRVFFSPGVIAILVAGVGFVLVIAFVVLRARGRGPGAGDKDSSAGR